MIDFDTAHSTTITDHVVNQYLMGEVWREVKNRQVGQLAPQSMGKESDHTVKSFVYQCFTEQYKGDLPIPVDKDPISAQIDSYAAGVIEPVKSPKSKSKDQMSLFGQKSRSLISEISKLPSKGSRISSKKNTQNAVHQKMNTQRSTNKQKKQSFFISLGYQEPVQEPQIQKIRKIHGNRFIEQAKMKKCQLQKLQKSKMNTIAQEKFISEKSKNTNGSSFTFDYEGSFYGVNPGKIQGDLLHKMKQKFGKHEVHSKQRSKPESTYIQNQRMIKGLSKSSFSKDKVEFSQKAFSIAEALGDVSKISQGVKITQLRTKGDSVILENKVKKLEGIKHYRLKDYKNMTKEKSFKEFPHTTPKRNSMYDLSQSLVENKEDPKAKTIQAEKSVPRSRGRSQQDNRAAQTQTILKNALGRGLPFIRTKGLRFYDIGGATNTFRTLEPNSTSKRSSKSKGSRIKIDDDDLFQHTFLN